MADKILLEEHEFPEPIIQHIQSLLTRKEAAETTKLSKSWYRAWLTRPNLDFDDSQFSYYRRGGDELLKYAKKTIKRYEQSNLKIESIKICMKNCSCGAGVKKVIRKALQKLGATRLFVRNERSFVLPCKVVFGAENLVELSVKGCKINLDGKVIKCCRLESLSLDGVETTRDTLSNIFSSCPLIEKLSLSNNFVDSPKAKSYYEISDDDDEELDPTHGPINGNLHMLRCLVLCLESFKTWFPRDIVSKFPFLTDFTLHLKTHHANEEDIEISSCSLERIKLELDKDWSGRSSSFENSMKMPNVELDVPSIRNFTYEGGAIPKIYFISSTNYSKEWESQVSITRRAGFTVPWFRELDEFLTQLRQSKIHLSLHVEYTASFDYSGRDVNILRKHELENLTINMTDLPSLSCQALFDGLFRLCRPKLITQERDEASYCSHGRRKTNVGSLCQALELGLLVKEWIRSQSMYGLSDLEEVNAQIFDTEDDVPEWRPVPLNSLLDDENNVRTQRHRFLLKWKP